MALSFIVLGLLVLVPTVKAVKALTGPVPRKSVEEFARLHSLSVTAGNGNQVIAYRATTRRWRNGGLALSVLIQIVAAGELTVGFWWVLAGWFAGAIVAELRVAHLTRGPRAAASLAPRHAADYLPTVGRVAVPGAMAVCAVVAGYGAVRHAADHPVDVSALTTWTVLGLGIGAVTLAAARHVLRRPQPYAEPDRLAADDAIRSRSLHVLAGAGMALVLYCVAAQLEACGVSVHAGSAAWFVALVVGLGPAVLGRVLAYWPWVPRRRVAGPEPEPA